MQSETTKCLGNPGRFTHVAQFICDAPSGAGEGHPNGAGAAGAPKRHDHNDLHPCSETRAPWRAKPGGSALKQYLDIRKSDIMITKTSGGGEIVSEVNQLCGARDTNITVLSNNPQRVSPIPSSVDM